MVANIIFGTNHSATTQPPVSAAVLFILLCTITVLHCILRRQLRQYVQSGPHLTVVVQLHIGLSDSSSCVQEKINHDNTVTVASVQVSNYTSFPKESGCSFCFSQLSPSDLEKASDNDTFNGMILCLSTSDDVSLLFRTHHCSASTFLYSTPARQSTNLMNAWYSCSHVVLWTWNCRFHHNSERKFLILCQHPFHVFIIYKWPIKKGRFQECNLMRILWIY